jgi:hypothetical protein
LNNKFFIPNTVQDGMQQYSFSILNNSSTIHMLQVTIDAFSKTPQVCQILYLGIWERMKEGHASKISYLNVEYSRKIKMLWWWKSAALGPSLDLLFGKYPYRRVETG